MICELPGKNGQPRTGTNAGYAAHRRNGEEVCNPCRQARRDLNQTYRGRPVTTPKPGNTRAPGEYSGYVPCSHCNGMTQFASTADEFRLREGLCLRCTREATKARMTDDQIYAEFRWIFNPNCSLRWHAKRIGVTEERLMRSLKAKGHSDYQDLADSALYAQARGCLRGVVSAV